MMRNKKTEVSITGPINLNDLRWLVEQCAEMEPNSQVIVKEAKSYNQMDRDPASITVRG